MKILFFVCLNLLLGLNLHAQKLIAFKSEQGKWGYKDYNTGTVSIAAQYDDARRFSGSGVTGFSYAAVKKNGKWGYIDRSGILVIDFRYEKAGNFSFEKTAIVKRDGKWFKLTPEGNHLYSPVLGKEYEQKLEDEFVSEEKYFDPTDWKSLLEDDGTYDPQVAFRMHKEKANAGNVESMTTIASWYLNGADAIGNRVEKNEGEAFRWFSKAAALGDQRAQVEVAKLYVSGKGTPQNIPEGFRLLKKEADKENRDAFLPLAELYRDGLGTTKNHEEAIRLLKKVADRGNVPALLALGDLYASNSPRKNPQEAFAAYKKVAEKGIAAGHYKMGLCYFNGVGTERNIKEALKYFNWAKNKYASDPDYWNVLAYCYFEQGNFKLAMDQLNQALGVDPAYANAYDSKGEMFLLGLRDTGKAISYFRKAASMGFQPSIQWLKEHKFSLTSDPLGVPPSLLEQAKEEIVYLKNNWPSATGMLYNGKRIGNWHFYYEKGTLWFIESYNESGTLEGTRTSYHPNGKQAASERYANGKLISLNFCYDENGTVTLSRGTGFTTEYHRNGVIAYRGYYQQNSRDGKSAWYHTNGQLKEEVVYKALAGDVAGLRWEVLAVYDRNGQPLDKGSLKNGNGTWNQYNDAGKLNAVRTYQNGVLKKLDEYQEGKLIKTTNY